MEKQTFDRHQFLEEQLDECNTKVGGEGWGCVGWVGGKGGLHGVGGEGWDCVEWFSVCSC